MMNTAKTVRYTATLPAIYIEELKELTKVGQLSSVNVGIREAVDDYLKRQKKAQFDALMKQAAKDDAFMERTLKCADVFSFSDGEVQGEW